MKKPNKLDIFLYFKKTDHSPSKVLIQPIEKIIYDPNSSSKLKNIKRQETEFKRHGTESLTLEFAILFLNALNIDFPLILISLHVVGRLLLH